MKFIYIIFLFSLACTNLFIDEKEYKAYPPITIIKNENGAGDSFIAIFNYFFCLSSNPLESIKKAICGGALQASGYKRLLLISFTVIRP